MRADSTPDAGRTNFTWDLTCRLDGRGGVLLNTTLEAGSVQSASTLVVAAASHGLIGGAVSTERQTHSTHTGAHGKAPEPGWRTSVDRACAAEAAAAAGHSSLTLRRQVHDWELLVVSTLKWDVCGVIACDFLDHLIHRIDLPKAARHRREHIRSHAQTFISLCYTEFEFILSPASMIAAASISSAVCGLVRLSWDERKDLHLSLHEITSIEVVRITTL
ncbi:hypothetical protein HPB48_013330 [Haemaphysalis longicornis]|uniref:Cyclin C-terminal domain-containing protein n=1 Tax=Haemaphysalis longicornis TaxID=44386 RepID=A0A9J6GYU6_HAELO|nr:hypothetical protein HPB48_013330 [Haemaphysalis longicornis]